MDEQIKQLIKKLATLRTGEDEVPELMEELFVLIRRGEWTEDYLS